METYWICIPFYTLGAFSDIYIISTVLHHFELNRIYEYQFILGFSVFDLLCTISSLLPTALFPSNHALCIIQGMGMQMFALSAILWAGYIAFAMLRDFVFLGRRFSSGLLYPLLIIVSITFTTAIIPLLYNDYGPTGPWCWIKNRSGPEIDRYYYFRMFLYYIYVWFVIILNLVTSFVIYWKVSVDSLYDFVGNRLIKRLKWYPWILCFCYTPLTILRIIEIGLVKVPTWYAVISSISFRLLGFFNAIAFFKSDKVRELRLGIEAIVN